MKTSQLTYGAISERSEISDTAVNFYKKAAEFDTHLVGLALAEYGKDHSNYALAVLEKANTLVVASASDPVVILDELAEA